MNRLVSITAWLLLLAGCGGGGSGGDTGQPPGPPPPPPVSRAEAYQLLNQATFGALDQETDDVIARGLEGWIDFQMSRPPSLQLPHVQSIPVQPFMEFELQNDRVDVWFRNVLWGDDQLRQRVAFALSEILVVSQLSALNDSPYALASYYDMLARNAFGNYRDLLEELTLHPAMGVYLSMLGNERPNPALNIRPDENYAREVMQLFSIGLVELNIDGSERLDVNNQPIPTYDQAVIEGFAHVFTGWTWAGGQSFHESFGTRDAQVLPMQLWEDFHDDGEKVLLGGETVPPGQGGQQDLSQALDNIFNHDNVGPFLAIRLIHRLTTSNPSPGYVQRVAQVFNDNGQGVRGDLGAVIKAILLDDEARPDLAMDLDGKVKEPLLRVTHLWRAYNATSNGGGYPYGFTYILFGQGPLQSPSVFNFFSPFYAPPGEIRNSGLVAPELQLATEYNNTLMTNWVLQQAFFWNQTNEELEDNQVYIDISEEMAISDDPDALIDMVAGKLLGGQISDTLRTEITRMLEFFPLEDQANRAAEVIYFVATSPEFVLQR